MKKAIIMGIIAIFLLPSSFSWSLQKGNEVIYFEPGLEKTISFEVNNYDGPTKLFMVEVVAESEELKGILNQVVHIQEPNMTIETGKLGEFHADIKLPNELSYGMHGIFIEISSDDPKEKIGQIRVRKALGFYIKVYSLYPGKLVAAKLRGVDSGNIGEVIYAKVEVRNVGTEDIENARARLDIYQDNNLVGSGYSDYMPITSKEVKDIEAKLLITDNYKIGAYTAKAVVEYDGKTEEAEYTQNFNIGELSISILNITSNKFENNKINKFKIDVESKWNKPAEVYAELILTDFSGQEVANFKTQAITLEGWQKGAIPAYLDLNDIVNGNYMLKVIIYYEEKMSRRTFAVQVSDTGEAEIVEEMPGMPKQTIIIILLSTVIGLLVIIILMMFFRRKKVTYIPYNEIR